MHGILPGSRTRTLFACLVLSILVAGCGRPAPASPVTAPSPEVVNPTITAEVAAPPGTIPAPAATAGEPSFLSFPHISGDAGNFSLLAGETIVLTWENAPTGADRYEFVLAPLNQEPSAVLGVDVDDSDGVAVSWTIPELVAAELHATAYFPDGRTTELAFSPAVYSGEFPPEGVCSLIARHQPVEVYRLPDRTAEIFALLYPAVYAHVLEVAHDGWYRIDASVAEVYTRSRGSLPDTDSRDVPVTLALDSDRSPASGEGWVNSDRGVLLTGSCPPG